jgi:hypothetical protein
MRFPKFASPLVAILAVALAAPIVGGCAVPTGDADGNVGTQSQAEGISPGDIASGASAALQMVQMFKSYQKYGEPVVTTGEILDKVNQTQADVAALTAAVGGIKDSITTTDKNVVLGPVVDKTTTMSAVFKGYVNISTTGTPEQTQAWLDKVGGPDAVGVEERWAELEIVNNRLLGKDGLSSGLSLIVDTEVAKGEAAVDSDAIGRFMATIRLAEEQDFFVLSKASAKNPAINLADQLTAHQARMAEQDTAFFAAMAKYNTGMLDNAVSARTAKISACGYAGGMFLGIETERNENAWFAYNDSGTAAGAYGQQNCDTARTTALATATADVRMTLSDKLWNAEQVLKGWNPRGVNIVSAVWASETTSKNVKGALGLSVQGATEITYKADGTKLSGTLPGSILQATYNCGPGTDTVLAQIWMGESGTFSCTDATLAARKAAADAAAAQKAIDDMK